MFQMFRWCLEFSEGNNVSVPLEYVITNDKYSLELKEDAKCEHFLCLEKLSTVQQPSRAEFSLNILLFEDESCTNYTIK